MSRPASLSKALSATTKSVSPSAVSRQSGQVTFPQSEKSSSKHSALSIFNGKSDSHFRKDVNPFRMPDDHDILMLRDKEKQKKKKERETQRDLKVHQKTTYTSRVNARTKSMIKPAADIEDDASIDGEKDKEGVWTVKEDPQFVLTTTRDRNIEKENLAEFIAKKREMFLVQYSLGVKRDEMRKLEEIAQAEEKKLELAEQYLEEDAGMFDEFLKENDKLAVEAIKKAESETKSKLEKVAEIKKINAQMMAIRSEISKNEDTLKEYMLYKQFLDTLAPQEWKEEKRQKKLAKVKEKERVVKEREKSHSSVRGRKTSLGGVSLQEKSSRNTVRRKESKSKTSSSGRSRKGSHHDSDDARSVMSMDTMTDDDESDEDVELFFTDPVQLLDIFTELEEQNLSLIQNSQETEEALDEMRQTIQHTQDKMNKETDALQLQISQLKEAAEEEQEKAAELKMKSKMFSYGEFQAEDQEKMLAELDKKVEEVYRNCIGDNEANISTLQMLTNIENRLEELFEIIEMLPQDKVELAEKAKEKERRLKQREEKLEAQRKHQEERLKKALERAQAEPKRKQGRKLNFRSAPPQAKKRTNKSNEKQDKEEEEMKYFFT
eukprot:Seg1873.5 transcript_id=Seg1873.5/GoldUCD/mRNA.D3Y31 product="Cilia- and flagella-associated protein 100" protein_id=Seg1873.5/GoldUCD/D3Y31